MDDNSDIGLAEIGRNRPLEDPDEGHGTPIHTAAKHNNLDDLIQIVQSSPSLVLSENLQGLVPSALTSDMSCRLFLEKIEVSEKRLSKIISSVKNPCIRKKYSKIFRCVALTKALDKTHGSLNSKSGVSRRLNFRFDEPVPQRIWAWILKPQFLPSVRFGTCILCTLLSITIFILHNLSGYHSFDLKFRENIILQSCAAQKISSDLFPFWVLKVVSGIFIFFSLALITIPQTWRARSNGTANSEHQSRRRSKHSSPEDSRNLQIISEHSALDSLRSLPLPIDPPVLGTMTRTSQFWPTFQLLSVFAIVIAISAYMMCEPSNSAGPPHNLIGGKSAGKDGEESVCCIKSMRQNQLLDSTPRMEEMQHIKTIVGGTGKSNHCLQVGEPVHFDLIVASSDEPNSSDQSMSENFTCAHYVNQETQIETDATASLSHIANNIWSSLLPEIAQKKNNVETMKRSLRNILLDLSRCEMEIPKTKFLESARPAINGDCCQRDFFPKLLVAKAELDQSQSSLYQRSLHLQTLFRAFRNKLR